jgi:hypothetical protein
MRALLLIVMSTVLGASGAGAACMKPDEIADARGRLTIGAFKDADDRPEKAFILRLPRAACLDATSDSDRVGPTRTVHVYSTEGAIRQSIGRLVGRNVLVRGKPFASHTAHHHAPIVMDVSAIRAR